MVLQWEYDKEVKWHVCHTDETRETFVLVYLSGGGDYVVTAMREGDCAGGEIEYRATLAQAKKLGEQWIADGTWRDYLQD